MTRPDVNKKCTYSPHLGPVGCLPAPNIFPLAKETFAKGKMFWNFEGLCLRWGGGALSFIAYARYRGVRNYRSSAITLLYFGLENSHCF